MPPKKLIENYERGESPPLQCQHLSLKEGLADGGCSGSGQPVSARMADGRLWFPDSEGIAVLEPQGNTLKAHVPVVLVDGVQADRRSLSATEDGELQMLSSVHRLEFYFTAPDLISSQNLSFRYKLEGVDNEWVDAGTQRAAYYSELKPGDYQFRVRIGGSDGNWHETDQACRLHVLAFPWERNWIKTLAGGLFIAGLGGGIFWGLRLKLRLQNGAVGNATGFGKGATSHRARFA